MKFYAVCGSNRKDGNTIKLLESALDGIRDTVGEENDFELVNLYKLDYTGCRSCFHCKKLGSKYYGKCPINDDLKPLLNDISHCDGLILGSPVYFGDISGQMRSFFERLVFPYFTYLEKVDSLAPRKFPVATIYDMNVPQDSPLVEYYETVFDAFEQYLHGVFSKGERLTVYDTYQFKDYSKYANDVFDADLKKESLENQFPKDLKAAYQLGVDMAKSL